MSSSKLRILSIAHPAVSRAIGRLRYHPFEQRRDLDVHLLVPAVWQEFGRTLHADPPDDPGVTVHIQSILLPKAGPMGWSAHVYPGLRSLIRRLDPDVIHLWEEPWSIVALQARALKGRAALVLEVDQNILKRLPPPFEMIRKHVLRHTDHILSRSPDATDVVRARGYHRAVTPIGYGVDQTTFHPSATNAQYDRAGLRLGYVGRLIEEKGLDDALDAMAQSPTNVSLAILGEGPYEQALRARVVTLGLGQRVAFRGWAAPPEVAEFIRGLDALLLLTRTTGSVREQFGRVIVEAQACGVPVIGSAGGAIPDVVGNGGWIVPERNPSQLAALIEAIAADPVDRRAKSQWASRNVDTRFTYQAVATALASACTAAAASRRKS